MLVHLKALVPKSPQSQHCKKAGAHEQTNKKNAIENELLLLSNLKNINCAKRQVQCCFAKEITSGEAPALPRMMSVTQNLRTKQKVFQELLQVCCEVLYIREKLKQNVKLHLGHFS